MDINNATITGRVGNEIEGKLSSKGVEYCTLNLAVSRPFKNKETDEYEVDWIRCIVYGKAVSSFVVPHISRGDKVAVTGQIRTSTLEKEDGTKITSWTLYATNIGILIKAPKKDGEEDVVQEPNADKEEFTPIEDDELPF